MNIYSIIAFIMALLVFIIGLSLASTDLRMFVDFPSMFIVFGGTLAATAICFQLDRIIILLQVFFRRVIMGKKPDYKGVIVEIMELAEHYRKTNNLESRLSSVKDPFFHEALTLINDDIMEKDELLEVLNERINNMYFIYMEEANRIKTIGKFPPAFGMMGTTIGMIVLLSNLGGKDAMKMIGPAMAVCLITTMYGVALANLVVIPVSENLIDSSKEVFLKNKIIVEGIRLLIEKENPIVVVEKLNSYLMPSQRLDWKKVSGK